MSDELIPRDSAQEIVSQVFTAMHKTIANQVNLSKQQLLQMMIAYFNKALQEYKDTVAKKIDEFTPKSE